MYRCRGSICVAVQPVRFRFTLYAGLTSGCTLHQPRCRVNSVDTVYTVDIVAYSVELVITDDLSTDTRCFYDRLLDVPYNGLSKAYTCDRNCVVGRVDQWFQYVQSMI
jgi:hypothetical protein